MNVKIVNIIALGDWNTRIFTPNWVAKNIFSITEETPMDVLFDKNDLSSSYSYKNIKVAFRDNYVEFLIDKKNDATFRLAIKFLNNLITCLPETPIKAIGINFKYRFKLLNKNEFDSPVEQFEGFKQTKSQFTKFLEDYSINIISTSFNENFELTVNYNYNKLKSKFKRDTIINFYKDSQKYVGNSNED